MNELRRFLGLVFGFVAVTCTVSPISSFIRTIRWVLENRVGYEFAWHVIFTPLDRGSLFLLGSSLLNAAACWTILAHKRSARVFGVSASVLPLAGMIPFMTLTTIRYDGLFLSVLSVGLALAIVGCVAFLPRRSETSAKPLATVPIRGDGTRSWINKSIWIVGTVAIFYAYKNWIRWAHLHDLPVGTYISFWGQLIVAELAFVFVHELGHAVAGLALGMRLRAFIVGPFQWRLLEGKWGFQFKPAAFLSSGGTTSLVPLNPNQPRWQNICMAAAGPGASLITGTLEFGLTLRLPGSSLQIAWPFFACFATLSVIVGLLNLVPFKTGEVYSDGAYIYQFISGGPWADYHHVLSMVASSLATPLRPRDFDINAINRASLVINRGVRAMLLQLFACTYYMDNEEFTQAAHASDAAEIIANESVLNVPAGLYTGFVFQKALLDRNAVGTRLWWDRMEGKRDPRFNVDYWLARTALDWMENRPSEARESWEKAYSAAQQLPAAGAYEFDRHRCEMLRKAMESSVAQHLEEGAISR